ncbi:hypothetical protein HY489_03805 [Candidatus Woesearchaeota archaeon]|nr:hypothetical protein [Candidatus Woesearchaeota archaeon]
MSVTYFVDVCAGYRLADGSVRNQNHQFTLRLRQPDGKLGEPSETFTLNDVVASQSELYERIPDKNQALVTVLARRLSTQHPEKKVEVKLSHGACDDCSKYWFTPKN